MYNILITVNNAVLETLKLLIDQIVTIFNKKEMINMWHEKSINQHTVQVKFIHLYINYIQFKKNLWKKIYVCICIFDIHVAEE